MVSGIVVSQVQVHRDEIETPGRAPAGVLDQQSCGEQRLRAGRGRRKEVRADGTQKDKRRWIFRERERERERQMYARRAEGLDHQSDRV